ncbi:MAG: GAF domain-containing protein [Thermoguttaceae bacterium]
MSRSKRNRLEALRKQSLEIQPGVEGLPGLGRLLAAFQEATGWSLKLQCGPEPAHPIEPAWSAPVNPGVGAPPGHVRIGLVGPASAASKRAAAQASPGVQKLASALAELVGQLVRTRHTLWQREAELAAGIPLVIRPEEPEHLAARLQAVLRGGAEAVGCQAAAVYLLDEGTAHLKLRSCWGLPPERLADPPRPLEGALADLEAMLGHAVVLEDAALVPHWNVPETFPSAACVPVATPCTILGTLWAFCQTRRDFSDQQTNILEIVAGRIAAELERQVLLQAAIQHAPRTRQVKRQPAPNDQPPRPPQLDGWDVPSWPASRDPAKGT